MKILKNYLLLFACVWAAMFTACSDDDESSTPAVTELKVSADAMTFTKNGGEQKLHVQAPAQVEVTSNQSWCTVKQLVSNSKKTLKYEVKAESYAETNDREALITVKSGSLSETVTVTQIAADGLIAVTPNFSVKAEGETITVKYSTNGEPSVSTDVDWIKKVTSPRASMQDKTVQFEVKPNYVGERTGHINFTLNELAEAVTVTQVARVYDDIGMNSDAKTLAAKMYAGINIGNTMEVPDGETGWGNPIVNDTYIKGIKDAGFNAVRIPCAWDSHIINTTTHEIDPVWLERVNEVVGYCVANDMYAIVNIHWDGGWLEDHIFDGDVDALTAKQKALWTQIATKLNHYDEHVLFAGSNELGMNETNSGGKKWDAASIATMVSYEQAFVDAVRATGGNNATRCLVVQGPGTDIASTAAWYQTLPMDQVENRMMVEVHFYEPYQFALMENDADWGKVFWYWGAQNHVSGSERNSTWGEEDHVLSQFGKMKSQFVDKGIPMIVGEYSAMARTVSENQAAHDASRAYWNEVITREAKKHGMVPFHWDTGSVINRNNGAVKDQIVLDGIMKGASEGTYPF